MTGPVETQQAPAQQEVPLVQPCPRSAPALVAPPWTWVGLANETSVAWNRPNCCSPGHSSAAVAGYTAGDAVGHTAAAPAGHTAAAGARSVDIAAAAGYTVEIG